MEQVKPLVSDQQGDSLVMQVDARYEDLVLGWRLFVHPQLPSLVILVAMIPSLEILVCCLDCQNVSVVVSTRLEYEMIWVQVGFGN